MYCLEVKFLLVGQKKALRGGRAVPASARGNDDEDGVALLEPPRRESISTLMRPSKKGGFHVNACVSI